MVVDAERVVETLPTLVLMITAPLTSFALDVRRLVSQESVTPIPNVEPPILRSKLALSRQL